MAKRGFLGSILSVIILSVCVYFIIFFFAPEASMQFFGTSIKDDTLKTNISIIEKEAESSGMFTSEELVSLSAYLNSKEITNTLIKAGLLTQDKIYPLLKSLKESL